MQSPRVSQSHVFPSDGCMKDTAVAPMAGIFEEEIIVENSLNNGPENTVVAVDGVLVYSVWMRECGSSGWYARRGCGCE